MSETVTISTLSGNETFAAYVARPAKTPKAAILVIQEIFGVNAGIRRKCDKLAEEGYLAVAPDLFWRLESAISRPRSTISAARRVYPRSAASDTALAAASPI